jgi:hypothetical protein
VLALMTFGSTAFASDARLQCALCYLTLECYNAALPLLQQLTTHANNPRMVVAAELHQTRVRVQALFTYKYDNQVYLPVRDFIR